MSRDVPPPLELACLTALWSLGEGTVAEVRGAVGRKRTLAYTTVMTLLDRLARKGYVTRRKQGRAFHYAPASPPDGVRQAAVRELVENLFDGSKQYLQRFLDHDEPSQTPAPASGNRMDTSLL
ncbi:MAG: BlaI/MecI/CopY family transcriptional regulator [Bryobacteraceae bacterium]